VVKDVAGHAEDSPMNAESDIPRIDRIVVFTLENQRYALPVDRVQEIQQIVEPTLLPDASASLLGLVDLRGRVLPLLDLRRLLRMPGAPYDLQTPMVIARTGEQLVAMVVDEVDDVIDVPAGCVQRPSGMYELADRMLGVCRLGEGLVFILDMETLVPEEQVAEVQLLVEGGL
jgi:purine-binding chemotaxis protein CheW